MASILEGTRILESVRERFGEGFRAGAEGREAPSDASLAFRVGYIAATLGSEDEDAAWESRAHWHRTVRSMGARAKVRSIF